MLFRSLLISDLAYWKNSAKTIPNTYPPTILWIILFPSWPHPSLLHPLQSDQLQTFLFSRLIYLSIYINVLIPFTTALLPRDPPRNGWFQVKKKKKKREEWEGLLEAWTPSTALYSKTKNILSGKISSVCSMRMRAALGWGW